MGEHERDPRECVNEEREAEGSDGDEWMHLRRGASQLICHPDVLFYGIPPPGES